MFTQYMVNRLGLSLSRTSVNIFTGRPGLIALDNTSIVLATPEAVINQSISRSVSQSINQSMQQNFKAKKPIKYDTVKTKE